MALLSSNVKFVLVMAIILFAIKLNIVKISFMNEYLNRLQIQLNLFNFEMNNVRQA